MHHIGCYEDEGRKTDPQITQITQIECVVDPCSPNRRSACLYTEVQQQSGPDTGGFQIVDEQGDLLVIQ